MGTPKLYGEPVFWLATVAADAQVLIKAGPDQIGLLLLCTEPTSHIKVYIKEKHAHVIVQYCTTRLLLSWYKIFLSSLLQVSLET